MAKHTSLREVRRPAVAEVGGPKALAPTRPWASPARPPFLPLIPSAGSSRPRLPVPSEGEPAVSPVSGFWICLIIDEFSA